MVVPVPATIPNSGLSPRAIASKFQSNSLAGIGDMVCDDSGCYDNGYTGGSGGDPRGTGDGGTVDLCALYPAACQGADGGYSGGSPTPIFGGGSPVDMCMIYPAGCPGGNWGGAGGSGGGGGYTVNPTNYNAVIQSLIKAGVDLSKLALVQPGTVLSANGNILRQNPGYSVPGQFSGNIGLGGNSSMFLIGGALLLGFMLMSQRKN